MDVSIKKIGQRDGKERFELVDFVSREVVTVNDVSEATLRAYFHKRGVGDDTLDDCFMQARESYEQATASGPPVDNAADSEEEDDLLFDVDLSEDGD